ncbi:TPA: hypothetical protein JTH58_005059, partial [Escherichia coli]|nr:hypothetical protein [Escherichia coli]
CLSQGISDLCFFSVVQVTDTDARVFFYDFLRLFQNIQFHLPTAYFLILSGDFLPQRIAFCLQGAKWHLNRSQFGIRIDHDLAFISDHSLASQSITIWHASDH